MEKEKVSKYVTEALSVLIPVLKPGASVKISAYTYPDGAIIQFLFRGEGINEILVEEKSSLKEAGDAVSLSRFIGGFEYAMFGGTNGIRNGNELIVIKEDAWKEWFGKAAKKDLLALFKKGGNK